MAQEDGEAGRAVTPARHEGDDRARVLLAHAGPRTVLAGVVRHVAESMRAHGLEVDVVPARSVRDVDGYDAVVVGTALVRRRWHRHARRFVRRHAGTLVGHPVWLFSCLDREDGDRRDRTVRGARRTASRLDARAHRVFTAGEVAEVSPFVARSAPAAPSDGVPGPSSVDQWGDHVAGSIAWEHHVRREVIRGTAV